MGRPKDKITSVRVRIDGWVKPGDPRVDALLVWMAGLPPKKRFPMVMRRLMEGKVLEDVLEDGDVDAARVAAEEIVRSFVVE